MKKIKMVLIFLFFFLLLNMPYGYYQLIRFFVMIGFVILAYNNHKKNQLWFIVWASSAILINPFFKIALGRDIWLIVDVIFLILLIISIFYNKINVEEN